MSNLREYIDYAFFTIYNFIQNIEGGYASQTDSRRALLVIYLFALLVVLNLVAFLQVNFSTEITILFWVICSVLFYLVYYYKQRYLKIIKKYRNAMDPPPAGSIITIIFILGSIVHFILRNP